MVVLDQVVQNGQGSAHGGLQQPGGGLLGSPAVGVLEDDAEVVAGVAGARRGLAELDEQDAGIRAGGEGVLGALPAQLPEDGHGADRVSLLEQDACRGRDMPVLRRS